MVEQCMKWNVFRVQSQSFLSLSPNNVESYKRADLLWPKVYPSHCEQSPEYNVAQWGQRGVESKLQHGCDQPSPASNLRKERISYPDMTPGHMELCYWRQVICLQNYIYYIIYIICMQCTPFWAHDTRSRFVHCHFWQKANPASNPTARTPRQLQLKVKALGISGMLTCSGLIGVIGSWSLGLEFSGFSSVLEVLDVFTLPWSWRSCALGSVRKRSEDSPVKAPAM